MDDLEAYLYSKKRCINIYGEIKAPMAKRIVNQIMAYILNKKTTHLTFFINSNGGCVTSALTIYDAMKAAQNSGIRINTVAIGEAMSAACFLLVSGQYRYATESSYIMMHQISYGLPYDYGRNNARYHKFIKIVHDRFYQLMANECFRGKNESDASKLKDFMRLIDDSVWLLPEDAKNLHWIDDIWTPELTKSV